MADLKISALPASTTPLAGTEILPIVQSATTRQVSVANLTAGRAVSALSLTSTNDATINGITVGRGGGSVNLNTAVGASALAATSTGDGNAAFGGSALASNLAGTGNTATGFASLRDNTSGNYNVASGYLALATNLSGASNVGIGYSVLSTGTATSSNTAIGYEALKVASGSTNTAIGYQSGVAMTSGTKNVILGSYSGNTGTLDIRISNNNIVLSDGDGNVRAWWDSANARFYGTLLATGITNSALTSGRVTYAGTSGVLQDSAGLTYDGTNLTTTGIATATQFVPSGSTVATNGMFLPAANTLGFSTNSSERMRIDSNGRVGIGTSSPTSRLTIGSDSFTSANANTTGMYTGAVGNGLIILSDALTLATRAGDKTSFAVDTSGNVGIGVVPSAWGTSSVVFKSIELGVVGSGISGLSSPAIPDTEITTNAYYNSGWKYAVSSYPALRASLNGDTAGAFSWNIAPSGTAGNAITFTQAMTLDASGNLLVGTTTAPSGSGNLVIGAGAWLPSPTYFQLTPKHTTGAASYYFNDNADGFFPFPDNTQKLGNPIYRWTTVYATTALINTSDVNTKQQIRDLSTAEKAVAQSIKGLIKAYKFNDSVAEKGDGARIHVGVIAQDVQSAFVAQGLDSSKYAMFCSDTWYEVDGQARNEKDGFYTKDSPNAVEVTRLGIRYDELLAFVISTL